MPARDADDQRAARQIESNIRAQAVRDGSTEELAWFMALPKRTRRSHVLLAPIYTDFCRLRDAARAEQDRLVALRAQPRNLSALRVAGTRPWNGIGRRKRRCRVFDAIGRAYTARQPASAAPIVPTPLVVTPPPARPPTPPGLRMAVYNDYDLLCQASRYHFHLFNTRSQACVSPVVAPVQRPLPPVPVMQLEPVLGDVPSRPPTPQGLCEALQSDSLLVALAGQWDAYGLNTPSSPSPTPTPPVIPPFSTVLGLGELTVFGQDVSPLYAYVVAVGQQALSPLHQFSMREAALEIAGVETDRPGLLGEFASFFFPSGLEASGDMLERFEVLLYFCRGWYELAA
ncbi:hypothetical protein BDV93DRAFT_588615 [Ceratobasidium sp. AG-I]|nr:hypothetical protein BDV93DRAFT_588615 [Ceratobasidium sp. AG-I]